MAIHAWYPCKTIMGTLLMESHQEEDVNRGRIRPARALPGWSQTELAEAAGVSMPVIQRTYRASNVRASKAAVSALVRALETAGGQFIAENGGGPGGEAFKSTE